MGGSSATNWLQYCRGHPDDYNRWNQSGWDYASVLPYFKKSENFLEGDDQFHGKNGPLNVRYPKTVAETTRMFIKAGEELGYPSVDYNGKSQRGFSISQQTIHEDGTRSCSAHFILPYLEKRKNLHLATLSHVRRIIFDDDDSGIGNRRAKAVEFSRSNGDIVNVTASKEIILSAGAFGSPQILLNSGVGPAAELKEVGVSPLIDLPQVGKNLQDHLTLTIEYASNEMVDSLRQDELESTPYILDYYLNKANYLAASPVQGVAFVDTEDETSNLTAATAESIRDHRPSIQLHFLPGQTPCRTWKKLFGHMDGYCDEADENKFAFDLMVILLRPHSYGSVKLRSNNPEDPPLIRLNFLSDPRDKAKFMEGIHIAQKVAKSKAYDKVRKSFKPQKGNPFTPESDEYFSWQIDHFATHLFHASCTNRMGKNSTDAVVDSELKVFGTAGNLRVADLSVLPEIIGGNTNAAGIMIGEKCADLIKQFWKLDTKNI